MVSSKLLSLVMEFADDGDLFQKISEHQRNGTYFTEGTIWKIFIQMVKGLKALHELKIMHRDLKVRLNHLRAQMCFYLKTEARS